MPRFACLVLSLLLPALAADNPVRKAVSSTKDFGQRVPLPTFDKGRLLFMNNPREGSLRLQHADGQQVFQTILRDPEGVYLSIRDAALDTDGTVAVAASSRPPTGGGAIVFLDAPGKPVRYVSTGRFMPQHICFDGHHTVWAIGAQQDQTMTGRRDREDHFLVRRFSKDGKEIGAHLPRSLFPGMGAHFTGSVGLWTVRAAGERIGTLADYVDLDHRKEWVEFDLEGNLLGRWLLPVPDAWTLPGRGMAYTADGRLFLGVWDKEATKTRLLILDRTAGEFRPVNDGAELDLPSGSLFGADGNDLVFVDRAGTQFTWYRPQ